MAFGVPYVLVMLPLAWGILLWQNPPEVKAIAGGRDQLLSERTALGAWTKGEKATVGVFMTAVLLWVTNPFWQSILPSHVAQRISWIDEYSIGLFVGLLPFFIPMNFKEGIFLLEWKDADFIDWGTLILFGGGIALSDAMFKTGVAGWIAQSFVGFFGTPSTFVMMFAIVFMIDFLTEVTSNTAVTGMLVPIVISIAIKTGENPVTLSIAAAVAASMAFMLPVATPPNALVYATGFIKLKEMVRSGFILDIAGWLATVFILYAVGGLLFGVLKF